MIRSFGDRETENVFQRESRTKFARPVARAALRKLLILDAAESLSDLRVPPGNRLEKLIGNRAGRHSVRVNDQWRVCFRWQDGDAYEVEIVDYHQELTWDDPTKYNRFIQARFSRKSSWCR